MDKKNDPLSQSYGGTKWVKCWSQIILFSSKQNFRDPDSPIFVATKIWLRLSAPIRKPSSWLAQSRKQKTPEGVLLAR
ncbi:MAG: hypothetical protein AAB672_00445, partial [Patescibacteria group bacterium]